MDGTTIRRSNIHATDLWKNQFEELGQTTNISIADGQQWYYLKGHNIDEVTFIKIWDSDAEVSAKRKFSKSFVEKCLLLYGISKGTNTDDLM
jgi:hypothetical protein